MMSTVSRSESKNYPTTAKVVLSERQSAYQAQDQIIIKIPSTLGNFNPLSSYLKFVVRIKNTGAQPFLASLDGKAGAWSIIQRIDIYAGFGALLESLQEVAAFMSVLSTYDNDKSKYGQRLLAEGFGGKNVGGYLSGQSNGMQSPYSRKNGAGVEYTDVEVCLPIYMSGIFNSNKILSLMALDGLELRILLRSDVEAITTFNAYGYDFNREPVVGADPTAVPAIAGDRRTVPVNSEGITGADVDTLYQGDTSQYHNFLVDEINGAAIPAGGFLPGGGAITSVRIANPTIANAQADGGADVGQFAGRGAGSLAQFCGLVGQKLVLTTNGANAPAGTGTLSYINLGTITGITEPAAGDGVVCAVNGAAVLGAAQTAGDGSLPSAALFNGTSFANRVDGGLIPQAVVGGGTATTALTVEPSLAFEVVNVQCVVGTVVLPPEILEAQNRMVDSEEGLVYEYQSYNLYRLQDNKAQKASILVPTLEGRAKSLVISPSPSSWGSGGLQWVNSALQPDQESLRQVQYLLNSTLQPDLPIDTLRSATQANGGVNGWDAIAVEEMTKAVERCGLKVNDLRNYFNHFTCGRRLSTDDHSYDAKTNEIRFNLEYRVPPTKEKQWFGQMAHIRTAVIKTDGIEVLF